MNLINVTVIPAQPGSRLIYMLDKAYEVVAPDLLAWRIETYELADGSFDSLPPLDV